MRFVCKMTGMTILKALQLFLVERVLAFLAKERKKTMPFPGSDDGESSPHPPCDCREY